MDKKAEMSPSVKGLLFFLMSLMIAAVVVIYSYFPYRESLKLQSRCTEPVTGFVVNTDEPVKDGVLYYGPEVEYTYFRANITLRSKIVNSIKLKNNYKDGDALALYFDPGDPSLVILRDDHTAENRFRISYITAAVIVSAGVVMLMMGFVQQYRRTRPKTFETTIDGKTFEEWKAEKLSEADSNDTADADTPDSTDKNKDKTS